VPDPRINGSSLVECNINVAGNRNSVHFNSVCEETAFLNGVKRFSLEWEYSCLELDCLELLWLRHGNVCRWKPLPEDWYRNVRLTILKCMLLWMLACVEAWTIIIICSVTNSNLVPNNSHTREFYMYIFPICSVNLQFRCSLYGMDSSWVRFPVWRTSFPCWMNQFHWLSSAVYETVKWQLKMTNSGIFFGRVGKQLGHDSGSLKRDA
jgi:hypothetical protein